MKNCIKRILAGWLTLLLIISIVPVMPIYAWNTSTTAPAALTDPEYMYPAFKNGKTLLDKKVGRLPALGWNSWNAFGSANTEVLARAMADKFIELELDKVGYEYIVLDDGCYANNRTDGKLTNHTTRFPSGFKVLSDYIHSLGLKFGMYNDVGIALCAGAQVGTNGFEDTDCETYKEWGVDYLKVDNCAFRWDVAYPNNTRYATQGIYPFAPRIRSVTVTGGSLNLTLNAVSDGVLSGNGGLKDTNGNCVYGIGILSGKQPGNDPTATTWSELSFTVEAPSDGVYDLVVNYASNGSDLGTNVETNSAPGTGRWLQVAVGPMESEKRFFDGLLPATSSMTTFVDSSAIQVELKAGQNTLRLMNRRRGENALQAYAAFRDSLDRCGNPDTILSLCEWGLNQPQEWAYKIGNSWRILDDIGARWSTTSNSNAVMAQYNKAVVMDEFAGLDKGWNDPDMMEIGNGSMTAIQNKTHMTMWCMLNSPIMLGNDLRMVRKGDDVWKVIANGDVIAFNQDPLGIQSKRIYCSVSANPAAYVNGGTNEQRIDVLAKPLANGDVALSFMNVGTSNVRTATVNVDDIISYIGAKMADGNGNYFKNAGMYLVYDVWEKGLTVNTTGVFTPPGGVNPFDNYTIRVSPISNDTFDDLISSAEAELQAKISGANPIGSANSALAAAIVEAHKTNDNPASTIEQIKEATLLLLSQLNQFRSVYNEQKAFSDAIDGAWLLLGNNVVLMNRASVRAAAEIFTAAIKQAESVLANPEADLSALIAAKSALASAVEAFEKAIDEVDVGKLLPPWYNKYPLPSDFSINSTTSLTVNTQRGDFWTVQPSTWLNKRPDNLHLIDIPNTAGDIEITAELTFSPRANYQTAGVLFYLDEYNIVSVTRRFHNGGSPNNCFMSQRNIGDGTGQATSSENRFTDYAISEPKCYLRLVKSGSTITGYYRESEDIAWRQAYQNTNNTNIANASVISVGFFAAKGDLGQSAPIIPATFENFKINGVLYPFTDNRVKEIIDVNISTYIGSAPPELPGTVAVAYMDGSIKNAPVVWDKYDPKLLNIAGKFTVEGTITGEGLFAAARISVNPTIIVDSPVVIGDDNVVISVDTTFDNYITTANKFCVLLAVYDLGGRLVAVDSKSTANAATETFKVTNTIEDLYVQLGYTIKVMVWDEATYIPVCDAAKFIYDGPTRPILVAASTNATTPANESVMNLFDNMTATKMYASSALPINIYMEYKAPFKVDSFRVGTANDTASYSSRNPRTFTLAGSNDGTNWTVFYTMADANSIIPTTNYALVTVNMNTSATYKHYRLQITAIRSGTSGMQMSEFNLIGPTNRDLYS